MRKAFSERDRPKRLSRKDFDLRLDMMLQKMYRETSKESGGFYCLFDSDKHLPSGLSSHMRMIGSVALMLGSAAAFTLLQLEFLENQSAIKLNPDQEASQKPRFKIQAAEPEADVDKAVNSFIFFFNTKLPEE